MYPPHTQHPYGSRPPPPKNSSNTVAIVVIVAIVVVFGAFTAFRIWLGNAVKTPQPTRADVDKAVKSLAAMHAGYPDIGTLEESACPKDLPAGEPFYAVHIADWDFMDRFERPYDPKRSFPLRSDAPWDLSDDSVFRLAPLATGATGDSGMANDASLVAKGKYVLVVRAKDKNEPHAEKDGTFVEGDYDGYAVLFDFDTAKPLCAAKINAQSSEKVTHREKGIVLGSTTEEALMKDLTGNVRDEAKKGLTRIAPTLTTAGL